MKLGSQTLLEDSIKVIGSIMFVLMFTSTVYSVDAQELKARGVVKANASATLSSQIVAQITKIPFAEGSRFQKGDTLVEFECARYSAQHKAAVAAANAERALLKQARTLRKFKAGGKTAVSVATAKVGQTDAEAEALEIVLRQCSINAPFSGRVTEWLVNEYELPAANQPLIKIVDDSKLKIDLLIPSIWLQWIKVEDKFEFRVDETAKTYTVEIERIAAIVDAVSQRIKVQAGFLDNPPVVLPGMSGVARFKPKAN